MGLRIQPLHVGTLVGVPKATLTYGRGHAELADAELIMFLITGGEHPVIVDTGSASPEDVRARHGLTMTRSSRQEPGAALETAGIDPADVRSVVNTHLHWDHSSNNHLFPNARVYVQTSELQYAIDPLGPHQASYERRPGLQPHWLAALGSTQSISGDRAIMPGVTLVHLPGHTPGSQGVLVEADNGRYLIAGDNVSCYDNWLGDDRLPHIPAGAFVNLHHYMDSFKKIEDLDCVVIPSHDALVLEKGYFD
jgi:N-acyl homoserine lactone hydrolase